MYNDIVQVPVEQRPFPMPFDEAGYEFINKALAIYKERQGLS